MRKFIAFLSTLTLSSTSIFSVNACNNQQNQAVKVEFELISKIEIQKTYNDKFEYVFIKKIKPLKAIPQIILDILLMMANMLQNLLVLIAIFEKIFQII